MWIVSERHQDSGSKKQVINSKHIVRFYIYSFVESQNKYQLFVELENGENIKLLTNSKLIIFNVFEKLLTHLSLESQNIISIEELMPIVIGETDVD